ncbi:MAG: hypothetical protein FWE14_07010 [Lachnospiraceae bacterium]|nr:hypothetical protein [Lachnospiraceae bacterium]
MKSILKSMQNRKNGIPETVLPLFEHIMDNYEGDECYQKFMKAMDEHLTTEQRFRIFEQNGGCNGTGYDKVRKAFALKHAGLPLAEKLELFLDAFPGRKAVLNDDNTITVTFSCRHGYYLHAPKRKFNLPASVKTYFERCAGGRLYEYQKALGVKLRIKSVDVSALDEHVSNPVVFVFEVIE